MTYDLGSNMSVLIKIGEGIGKMLGIDGKYFLQNGIWSMIADGAVAISGIVVAAVFARVGSPESFGGYQLVLSIVGVVSIVSIKGLDNVIIRDVSQKKEGVFKRAVKIRWQWSLWAMPIMLLGGGYFWQWGEENMSLIFIILAVLMPAFYVGQLWPNLYKGRKRFDRLAKMTAGRVMLVMVTMLVVIIISGGNVVAVTLTYFVSQVIANLGLLKIGWREIRNDEINKDWLNYSYFISKTGLVKAVVANIDKILIGILVSSAALAIYAVALVLPKYALIMVKSLFQTTSPKLSRRHDLTFKEVGVVLLMGVLFTGVTMILSKLLIVSVFGEQYEDALVLAYIVSLAMIFHPLAQLINNFVQMTSRRKVVLACNTFSPVTRLMLIGILGWRWQTVGFAWAYAVTSLIWVLISLSVMKIDFKKRVVT